MNASATGTVGFVGLGTMGGAMAARLAEAGHRVRGCDIDAGAVERLVQHGGAAAATPVEAAREADVLVLMVHDAAQVEQVLFGASGATRALRPGATVWLASTVTPAYARALAPRLAQCGVELVDGPVSGGATGAQAGELTVIAGGSREALNACTSVMRACASQVFVVGLAGAGSTVKMINQVLVAAHIALTAEVLALGARAGVSPWQLIEVVTHSAGNSRMFEKRAPRMAAGDHAPHSTVNTFLKDLDIALNTARELGLDTPLAATARTVFARAALAGHGSHSDTLVSSAYQA